MSADGTDCLVHSWLILAHSFVAWHACFQCHQNIILADMGGAKGNRMDALDMLVGQSLQTLQEEVLHPLSQGWGAPLMHCFIHLGLLTLGSLLDIMQSDAEYVRLDTATGEFESENQELNELANIIFGCAIAALLLVIPPVLTSDACAQIPSFVNNIRTVGDASGEGMMDSELKQQLSIIETYLKSLNHGAGPGFVIFRTVLTKSVLAKVVVKSVTYALILKRLESIFISSD